MKTPKFIEQRLLINQKIWELKNANSPKIFGIGNNKTGTTSLKIAMRNLGYKVGDQNTGELLLKEWAHRNFSPIIDYCRTAEFFQDIPFSKPFTYVALDQAFPKSKFILTIRDNPEQWYRSLTRYHSKKWGTEGRIPTMEDLQNAEYLYKGWAWDLVKYDSITPENDPYEKTALIQSYIDYNNSVISYFKHRPEDLLILNVAEKGAHRKLCKFIGEPVTSDDFPWENKT